LVNLPGPPIAANVIYTNAQVAPELGRPLSSASTVTIAVVPPNTLYGERWTQLDARLAKTFRIGSGRRIQGQVDFYNLFNSNAVTQVNGTYSGNGALWSNAQAILPARLIKFGVQIDF
jgi:hypothetical protein